MYDVCYIISYIISYYMISFNKTIVKVTVVLIVTKS